MQSKSCASKKLKEICQSLGTPYKIKIIDLEHVLYRDLGNGYDFEVSGLNNNTKTFKATLYIWEKSGEPKIVERVRDITSFDMLKDCLTTAEQKYL